MPGKGGGGRGGHGPGRGGPGPRPVVVRPVVVPRPIFYRPPPPPVVVAVGEPGYAPPPPPNLCCALICAVLLPPLGVWYFYNNKPTCFPHFIICLLLTCLGYVPGVIYACIVIGCAREVEPVYVEQY